MKKIIVSKELKNKAIEIAKNMSIENDDYIYVEVNKTFAANMWLYIGYDKDHSEFFNRVNG